ncbi:MAG: homoserine kinase [Bdellovibrionales bacterium]|jgi:homoserine kinase type II|nr:homoserine kinase [Bdellovibrionales bacterium]
MAVYTRIDEKDLQNALDDFNIGALQKLEGIADGVENSNYHLHTTQGRYILTLFEKRVNRADLPFYLSYMAHLKQAGINCPAAEKTKSGAEIFTLAGKPAIITTFLHGASLRDITPAHCAALGETLARMHLAAADFAQTRANTMGITAWRDLITASASHAEKCETGLYQELQNALTQTAQTWPQNLPQGCVHADLFPDNVFFSGDALSGVIDFYFACTEIFAYDLMLTLNPWCFDKSGHLDTAKSAALLAAYHAVRPLSADEIAALPAMGQAAALRIVATRMYDSFNTAPDALVTPKDPMEHVRIMRFHQSAQNAAAYGFAP